LCSFHHINQTLDTAPSYKIIVPLHQVVNAICMHASLLPCVRHFLSFSSWSFILEPLYYLRKCKNEKAYNIIFRILLLLLPNFKYSSNHFVLWRIKHSFKIWWDRNIRNIITMSGNKFDLLNAWNFENERVHRGGNMFIFPLPGSRNCKHIIFSCRKNLIL
jgi:hypothetical protein